MFLSDVLSQLPTGSTRTRFFVADFDDKDIDDGTCIGDELVMINYEDTTADTTLEYINHVFSFAPRPLVLGFRSQEFSRSRLQGTESEFSASQIDIDMASASVTIAAGEVNGQDNSADCKKTDMSESGKSSSSMDCEETQDMMAQANDSNVTAPNQLQCCDQLIPDAGRGFKLDGSSGVLPVSTDCVDLQWDGTHSSILIATPSYLSSSYVLSSQLTDSEESDRFDDTCDDEIAAAAAQSPPIHSLTLSSSAVHEEMAEHPAVETTTDSWQHMSPDLLHPENKFVVES